jgi:hypothetical protein
MVNSKIKKERTVFPMETTQKLFVIALTFAVLVANGWAEGPETKPAANATAASAPPPPITAADVQALIKDALAAQQKEIDELKQQLRTEQAWREQHSTAPADIKAVTTEIPAPSVPAAPQQIAALTPAAVTVQQDTTPSGMNLQDTAPVQDTNPMHSNISIHFKGITITPGGFAEAAFVRRSRALGSDLPTPFNNLTMPGASQSQLSEFFGSARQSRPTVYVDGRLGHVDLSSYVSGDFLSSGDTSTATQTNSYTFRLRQVWGQAKFDNGWSFLGGQAWSLVTENKAGIGPSDDLGRTNDARPMTIDPQYTVGFTFARQYGIRVTKSFNDKLAFAVAMENAQGTLTTHGNSDNFLLGSEGATNSYNGAVSACTTSSYTPTGATTPTYYTSCSPIGTYTFNPSPDIIAKVAIDPGFGHYEIFGLYDRFRDRVFPCANFILGTTGPCPTNSAVTGPSGADAYNVSKNGGAIGANARWNFDNKHIVFGVHFFGGEGVGRYGASNLADLSIHANGNPDLIRNGQGLGTLEWHGKKLDIYSYAGVEYDGRAYDFNTATNAYVGYGAPQFSNKGCYSEPAPSIALTNGFNPGSLSNCTADTRVAVEGTIGFWYRFYSGPRGRFQFGTQYSYVTRQTWSGVGPLGASAPGVSPEGLDGMIFTSFRYYLP